MSGSVVSLPPQHSLLLRILANPDGDYCDEAGRLNVEEAAELLQLARRTRAAPVLKHVLRKAESTLALNAIAAPLAEITKAQSLIALGQARALTQTVGLLRVEGIEAVALKGVALAFDAYPAPHLRSLRDLDLLVRPDQVERAYRLLLQREDFERAPWAGTYGKDHGHQMPEIIHRATSTVIELHHRLNGRNWPEDRILVGRIWENPRTIELMGDRILVPASDDNLLHLVEHAGLHHAFANGPLVLADLHFLAKDEDIDWEAIEERSRETGLWRAFQLLCALGARNGAGWAQARGATVPEDVVSTAEHAICLDEESHRQLAQMHRLAERGGVLPASASAFGRAFMPDRHELSRLSGRPASSLSRWRGYPRWLVEKGGRFLAGRRDEPLGRFSDAHADIVAWMEARPCD